MSKRVSLAMKTTLRLSWNQHRMQKQYPSKSAGVKCESEKKDSVERKRILGDNLKVKMLKVKEKDEKTHDSVGGLAEKHVPVVLVPDLCAFVKE